MYTYILRTFFSQHLIIHLFHSFMSPFIIITFILSPIHQLIARYYLKDINFMNRDEIMIWFQQMRAYKKKVAYLKVTHSFHPSLPLSFPFPLPILKLLRE